MEKQNMITTLFLDIGGVLLSNGWGHESRHLAAAKFNLDIPEMDARHKLTFNTYELGKLTLDEYLDRTVFYKDRSFTKEDFREYMFAQSTAHPEMIEMVIALKKKYGLKIAVVSNEGKELNAYRIQKFSLTAFVDFFISSSFVHFSKPDIDIFRIALDIAQVNAKEVVYIEDQPMFISIAESLGIKGIRHTNYENTCKELASFGLNI
jgi:putative hydrolase of the HAD superfamily